MRPGLIGVAALLAVTGAASGAQSPSTSFEGRWINPKHNMVVDVSRCGADYCAIVVNASAKAQANARKGGTLQFIGTEVLRVRPTGRQTLKGKAFDPETNQHVSATVTVLGPGRMDIRGCAFFGMVCEDQHWTKVS